MAGQDRQSIESEMEAVRTRLAGNIDQLVYRSSPKTIAKRQVADVKGFFVDPNGGARTDNILKVVGGVVGVIVVFAVIRRVAR